MILQQQQPDIGTMNLVEAYKYFTSLREEGEYTKEYNQIRNGIKLKFDIYKILNEHYTQHCNTNQVYVWGDKWYPYNEFMTELEQREAKIKKLLYILTEDESILKSRIDNEEEPEEEEVTYKEEEEENG